jgi:hypothetical protein
MKKYKCRAGQRRPGARCPYDYGARRDDRTILLPHRDVASPRGDPVRRRELLRNRDGERRRVTIFARSTARAGRRLDENRQRGPELRRRRHATALDHQSRDDWIGLRRRRLAAAEGGHRSRAMRGEHIWTRCDEVHAHGMPRRLAHAPSSGDAPRRRLDSHRRKRRGASATP